MRLAVLLLLSLALTGVAAAQDPKGAPDASRFDGARAGVISCPAHVEDTGARGCTPYSYRIKAHFDGTRGTGTRLDSSRCDFTFTRE